MNDLPGDLPISSVVKVVPTIPAVTSSDEKAAPDAEWSMNTEYLGATGWRQAPLSAPDINGVTCRFVKESAGLGQKIVLWHCERIGAMPRLPAVEPDTDKQKLLERRITAVVPMLMGDGKNFRIVVTGHYLYGLDRPPDPANGGLPMGHALTDTTPASANVIQPSNFKAAF